MPILPLLLACLAVPAAAQSRLWRANHLDPADFVPTLVRAPADTALIRSQRAGSHAGYSAEAGWNGILHREEDGGKAELFSAGATQSLWARLTPGSSLSLDWRGDLARNRLVDPGALDSRLGLHRPAFGMTWHHSVMADLRGATRHGHPFLDMAVRLPDTRRQAFSAMLAGGVAGRWRLEAGLSQEEAVEDAKVVNLDTAGGGETVEGLYQGRVTDHRLVVQAPLLGGSLSVLGGFGQARPRRPEREFWFCDSSRQLRGLATYGRTLSGGAWRAWGEYREGEAVSIGRRIPPGSEGVKRFHFARNHAVVWDLGGEGGTEIPDATESPAPARRLGWRAGAHYRHLGWSSDPPPDALDSRRETLSFNRLGLSFVANLYGGLYKLSEIVSADLSAGLAEAQGAAAYRLGPFSGEAGLSLWRAGFEAEAVGKSLSQRLIVVDTAESFRGHWRGTVWGATPRVQASLAFAQIRLEAEAAQALPFHVDINRLDSPAGQGGPAQDDSRYAAFRNGFAARLRLAAGF